MASDGASFLLGVLGEASARRERSQKVSDRLMELVAEQQVKSQLDPEARFKGELYKEFTQMLQAQQASGQPGLEGLNTDDLKTQFILSSLGITVPKSPARIQQEEFARKSGELQADPYKPQKEQAEIASKQTGDRLKAQQYLAGRNKFLGILPHAVSDEEVDRYLKSQGGTVPSVSSTLPPDDGSTHPLVGQVIHGEKIKRVKLRTP